VQEEGGLVAWAVAAEREEKDPAAAAATAAPRSRAAGAAAAAPSNHAAAAVGAKHLAASAPFDESAGGDEVRVGFLGMA
jgi:hypothetical protein